MQAPHALSTMRYRIGSFVEQSLVFENRVIDGERAGEFYAIRMLEPCLM